MPSSARRQRKRAAKPITDLCLEGMRGRQVLDARMLSLGNVSSLAGRPAKLLRKEVIQPQVPLRLPCYDFTPVADPTVVGCPLTVGAPPSGRTNSHGVTGGVYKARERIHRGVLIRDY